MCLFDFTDERMSVVKISHGGAEPWYHLSKGPRNWILRGNNVERRHEPQLADLPPDCQVLQEFPFQTVRQLTGMDTQVSIRNEPEHWNQIFAALDAPQVVGGEGGNLPPDGDGPGNDPDPAQEGGAGQAGHVIPITGMRQLYSLLEDFNSKKFQLGTAREAMRSPVLKRLAERFRASIRQFSSYQNEEAFHPDRPELEDFQHEAEQPQEIPNTADFTRRLHYQCQREGIVVNDPSLNFTLVDYEVPPARTTNRAVFADGRPARRAKTLDWLLANAKGQHLIVGEVKIREDKNPFFALIQALMYTAELVTASQIQRLQNHYEGAFAFEPDPIPGCVTAPKADVYIILCGHKRNGRINRKLYESFEHICEGLMLEPALTAYIRRIACLDTRFNDNNKLRFFKLFAYPEATEEYGA